MVDFVDPGTINAAAFSPVPTINGPYQQVRWESGDVARFTKKIISASNDQVYSLSIINSRGDIEATSGTGATSSNQREVYALDGTHGLERGKALFYSGPKWDGTIIPQHGLAFRLNEDGSRRHAIIIWQNVIFGVNNGIHAGVWSGNLDGTGFLNRQTSLTIDKLVNSRSITSATRTNNVATLPVGYDHGFAIGDRINVNAFFAETFVGAYIVSDVTLTTISYPSPGTDEVASPVGNVSKSFPYWVEAKIDDPNTNVVDVRAYNPEDVVPAWTSYDSSAGLYVQTSGAGSPLSTPDATVLDITTDTTFMAEVTLPDWTPSVGNDPFIAKRSSTAGQFSYIFGLENSAPSGRLTLFWTSDGSTTNQATSTVANSFTDGTRNAVAASIDVDNGASGRTIKFYTAPSINGPWSQLGADVVQANTTSIFNSTSPVEIGSQQAGANSLRRLQSGGRIHAAKIRAGGLTGTLPVVDFFGPNIIHGTTSFNDRAGRAFTVASPGTITNTGYTSGTTAAAFSVDLDESGAEDILAANPTPTSRGLAGLVAAHLGTDDASRCVYGTATFGFIPDSTITVGAEISAPTTLLPLAINAVLAPTIDASAQMLVHIVDNFTLGPNPKSIGFTTLSYSVSHSSPSSVVPYSEDFSTTQRDASYKLSFSEG